MKKTTILITIAVMLFFTTPALALVHVFSGLTGATLSDDPQLDGIPTANISNGEIALGTDASQNLRCYVYDVTNDNTATPEDGDLVIVPNDNASGFGAWEKKGSDVTVVVVGSFDVDQLAGDSVDDDLIDDGLIPSTITRDDEDLDPDQLIGDSVDDDLIDDGLIPDTIFRDGELSAYAAGMDQGVAQADDVIHRSVTADLLRTCNASEPASVVVGQEYCAVYPWDPTGSGFGAGVTHFVKLVSSGPNVYKLVSDQNGNWYFAGIELPTLDSDELGDDSDPHDLTALELKGSVLSNINSSGADQWNFPALSEGWNFVFIKETDQNVTLEPNGTENWYFRTDNAAYTANGAGTSIINTTSGKSTITCFSTETSVFCTGDANWEQGS